MPESRMSMNAMRLVHTIGFTGNTTLNTFCYICPRRRRQACHWLINLSLSLSLSLYLSLAPDTPP